MGRDILQGLGLKIDFENLQLEWAGSTTPMKNIDYFSSVNMYCEYEELFESELVQQANT